MVLRSLTGITVSLFKPPEPDTCQIRLRESACTVPLLITSWDEILLVSEMVQHLNFSLYHYIVKHGGFDKRNLSARRYNLS